MYTLAVSETNFEETSEAMEESTNVQGQYNRLCEHVPVASSVSVGLGRR